mgnify:CR=1 FL=1
MSERDRRWRLVLGDVDDALPELSDEGDRRRDEAMSHLYERTGGLGRSGARVARWLGDVRTLFPPPAAELLQQDVVKTLDLARVLQEPELLAALEPDVALAAELVALSGSLPDASREAARGIVQQVVSELAVRIEGPVRERVRSATQRRHTRRPRNGEVDWGATIARNLRTYDPVRGVLVPEVLVGRTRSRTRLHHVILCVDQSGSMSESMVYASIAAAALSQVPSLKTELLAFDVRVADLTEYIADPVAVLFGAQLGGGTDIGAALRTVSERVTEPERTVVVLISDLFDGATPSTAAVEAERLVSAGVQLLALLAITEQRNHTALPLSAIVALKAGLDVDLDQRVVIQTKLAGRPGALALRFHRRFKAGFINGQLTLTGDVTGQVHREAVGVIELEDDIPRESSVCIGQCGLKQLKAFL